jgi:hypothetical protein
MGLRLRVKLSSFSDSCDRSIIDSTVILWSSRVRRGRCDRNVFGDGMLVSASKAATDGGMASGEWTSLGR